MDDDVRCGHVDPACFLDEARVESVGILEHAVHLVVVPVWMITSDVDMLTLFTSYDIISTNHTESRRAQPAPPRDCGVPFFVENQLFRPKFVFFRLFEHFYNVFDRFWGKFENKAPGRFWPPGAFLAIFQCFRGP